jgi:16S rRNA (guanine1516-N2)-methyltransferase
MSLKLAIVKPTDLLFEHALALSQKLGLALIDSSDQDQFSAVFFFQSDKLALKLIGTDAPGPISVDFLAGKYAHRRKYGGGKGQLLTKAIGLSSLKAPTVLDLTAGLGQDAFVLACCGCRVQMIERSPIIAALVQDALRRAQEDPSFSELKLQLTITDSFEYLNSLKSQAYPDVIYLDPMFPSRSKSALVKKEMRILRAIVGEDPDADKLLPLSRAIAKKRVVVKRPRHAPELNNLSPDLQYRGQSSRFDVYLSTTK